MVRWDWGGVEGGLGHPRWGQGRRQGKVAGWVSHPRLLLWLLGFSRDSVDVSCTSLCTPVFAFIALKLGLRLTHACMHHV